MVVANSAIAQPWHMILHCGKVFHLCLEGISGLLSSSSTPRSGPIASGVLSAIAAARSAASMMEDGEAADPF